MQTVCMVAIVMQHGHLFQTLPATLYCSTFPFNVSFTVIAALLQPWTPAGVQAYTPIKKGVGAKTPKLVLPFGSGCIPPALTTLLLSDAAGVMGSDNVCPVRQFRQSNQLISQVRGEWPDKGHLQPLVSVGAKSVFGPYTLMSLAV